MGKLATYFLLLFACQVITGQNICRDFKSCNELQNWIKEVNKLESEEQKIKIIQRIECEQKSKQVEDDLRLRILIDGYKFFTVNEIPIERIIMFQLIPANCFSIAYSSCESEEFSLGSVLISDFDKLILNQITQLTNIRAKRRGGKIILKFESVTEHDIELNVSGFLNQDCTKLIMKTRLKIGGNKIVIRRSDILQYIELNLKGNKLNILI